ncbi:Rieske 2Fe-2S domain-containing protein [Actinocorallia longicatena]|uniref:Rieske-type oxygenase n=1 Tax=Actinocorallia longicatena TaxID=111803 RepID=A0ABP6QJT4_9ACTN
MSRYPFPAVPDGWFAVAASEDLVTGEVTTLHYLDRELVAFRGEDGGARVFDAHCPHLGAHLGVGGRVCGDGIVCPFHGWRFDGDGLLAEVPRLDRRPPRVSAGTWPVCELNGRLFVWHHAGGAPPAYALPHYRSEGAWTPWRVDTYRVRVHVQELTENIIDRSHFYAVHDMVPPDDDVFEVTFTDHVMTVDQNIKVTALADTGYEVRTRTTVCGPGAVAVEVREGSLDMLTYITQTPVDAEISEITICFSMAALEDAAFTASVAELNAKVTNLQFTQDVPLWENKIYRDRPRLTAVDGPIAAYRRWFDRFYSAPGAS